VVGSNEPHEFEPYPPDGSIVDLDLERIRDMREVMEHPDAEQALSIAAPLVSMVHVAEQAGLEALRSTRETPIKGTDFDMYLRIILTLTRVKGGITAEEALAFWEREKGLKLDPETREAIRLQLEPLATMLMAVRAMWPELDDEALVQQVKLGADPNLHERAPGRYAQTVLRNAKRRNLDRNSRASDMVDLHHAQFLPYVDVFTTDRENESILRRHLPQIRKRRASILVRVGRLDAVADAIERVAASGWSEDN
jgi:hypothetical protein